MCHAEKQGDILKENLPINVNFDLYSNYIIQTENLNFGYGNESLYKPVNLKISQGEKIAIIGKSGSGKSTLLLLLTGMLRYSGANCRMRLASHWQNKKRHCDVSCIILSDQTKMRRYVQWYYPLSS
ncbi:ATP-binding cassette domain-containing protein [Limosilactobacillus fermentum]|uniref:ATP-binding cassette domain-containing protein n=1 Tax=Limosilactobacillus fermentum TaxID=1613 RepID=UPI0032EBED26